MNKPNFHNTNDWPRCHVCSKKHGKPTPCARASADVLWDDLVCPRCSRPMTFVGGPTKLWRCDACGAAASGVVPSARAVAFTVMCHGDRQEVAVTIDAVLKALAANDPPVFGVAFHPLGEPLVTTRRGLFGKRGRTIRREGVIEDARARPGESHEESGSHD